MRLFAEFAIALGTLVLSFSANRFAAVMSKGKVIQVFNMTSQQETFSIIVEGSRYYPCNNNNVVFNQTNFPDKESFERTYSMVFAAGYMVETHNSPESVGCLYVNYIAISK